MRRRWIILVVAVVALVGALAGGAFAYEQSREDVIADGITIGGIDVGGLDATAARQKVSSGLDAQLRRPVVVQSLRSRLTFDRDAFGVRADVDGAIREALARSTRGSFVTRAWRDLLGEGKHASLAVRVRYSPAAVDRVVDGFRRSIDESAESARLHISVTSLDLEPGRDGIRVLTGKLRRELVARLLHPGASPTLDVPTEVVRPPVTPEKLRAQNGYFITIDRDEKRLRLFRRLKLARIYQIAVGRIGLETPAGLYRIRNKAINPAWYVPKKPWAGSLAGKIIPGGTPDNPIKARWLGIYDGAGIHGTDDIASLGTAVSHGCIRMSIPDVIKLYNVVPVGTRVYIV